MKTQKQKTTLPSWQTIVIFILFGIFIFTVFYNLGKAPLQNWDEAFYGENIQQILRRNDWIVMYFNNYPFNDKPPLYMWIGAVSAMVFGMNEFAVRLPSAIAGIAVVFITVWYVYKKFGFTPAVAAYSSLGLSGLYMWRTREGDLDTLSTLFFVLIYFLILSKHKYKYQLLGLCFALLYLTKLALVAVPIAIFGLYELVYELKNLKKNFLNYVQMVVIMVGVPALWFIPVWMTVGQDALRVYLFRADGGSFKVSLDNLGVDYIRFAYYALQRWFFPMLVWGMLCVILKIKERWNFLTFLFSTVIFAQLLFFQRKNNWYLIPLMPFWSIAIAYGIRTVFNWLESKKMNYLHVLGLILALLIIVYSIRSYMINIVPMFNTFGTTREMQTALKAKELTKENEPIVRLDHLFPTAIYYSQRRVHSSPVEYTGFGGFTGRDFYISRDNLAKGIKLKKTRIVIGKKADVEAFITKYSLKPVKIIPTNDEEVVAQF